MAQLTIREFFPVAKKSRPNDAAAVAAVDTTAAVAADAPPTLDSFRATLDPTQTAAFDAIVVERRHTLVGGPGGVGKSYTLVRAIRALRALTGCRVDIVTPTGIAAVTLGEGATTIHQYMALGLADKPAHFYVAMLRRWREASARLCTTDVLIIDEISMVSASLFELMDTILREVRARPLTPFGGIQLVLCGDFCQIPPVQGEPVYTSPVYRSLDIARFDLGVAHRQHADDAFASLLQRARFGALTDDDVALLRMRIAYPLPSAATSTRLCCTNVNVDAVNAAQLAQLDASTEHVYRATYALKLKTKPRTPQKRAEAEQRAADTMRKALRTPDELRLRLGARVMMLRNIDTNRGLANGTIGRVIGFDDGDDILGGGSTYPIVAFERCGTPVRVEPFLYEFADETRFSGTVRQLPLTLAWSLTLHKSQSTTLSSATMDLRASMIRGAGLAYTGLSRVRSLDTLTLVGIDKEAFYADRRSVDECERRTAPPSSTGGARPALGDDD